MQLADVHGSQLVNVLVEDAEMKRFAVEACSLTLRTHVGTRKLVGPLLCRGRSFFFLHQLDVFHNTVVRHEIVRSGMHQRTLDTEPFVRAVQHIVYSILGKLGYRSLQGSIVFFEQCFELPEYHHIFIFAQGCQCSFVNRKRTIRYHLIYINKVHIAHSLTARTRTLR